MEQEGRALNDNELAYQRGYSDGRREAEKEIAYRNETIGRLVIELAAVKKGRDEMCQRCGYKEHSIRISELHDCNDCGIKDECAYMPRYGEYCRINCQFWVGENESN